MKINTTPGETYIVLSTGGCTVTTGAGKQIKKLAAGQDFFTAMTGDSILSDDNASVTVAKGEILSLLSAGGSAAQATLQFQPVTNQSALPTTGDGGTIYLVPNGSTGTNKYTEWVWTGSAYEQLGDVGVDLSGYAKKSSLYADVQQAFTDAGYSRFEVDTLTVNSGGAYISGLTIQNPMGGPGSKLTADDGIVQNSESFSNQHLVIHTDAMVKGGLNAKRVITAELALPAASKITMGEGSTIEGAGWDAIVADIQAGVASATAGEAEQSALTKLIFPPTGTATEEQDPSWITKSHILMETSGGQLNMTHLAETLAYAAQTPLAIAKLTLWLSTSPGTGDAVQWPANTIFQADQAQDTVQQLNSNSTYWFDITYVGGIGKLLVRTVCVWPTVMDTNEPTD